MSQQVYSLHAEWKPTSVFNPDYHDYATVVMDTYFEWSQEHMFAVWGKSKLTVTVNDGTETWFIFLLRSGIDVRDESNKKYVPTIIIVNVLDWPLNGLLSTAIDLFTSLGSKIWYVPDQHSGDYVQILERLLDSNYVRKMKLNETYVFAEKLIPYGIFGPDTTTLYRTNGEIAKIRIIMVRNRYFLWMLHPGVHKIHMPTNGTLLKPFCGVLPDPAFRKVTSCSTNSLASNLINASVADISKRPSCKIHRTKDLATVKTHKSTIWFMELLILEEITPKASNESTIEPTIEPTIESTNESTKE